MSLETDTYTITTADGKYKIGRHVIEDKSLLPKNIVAFEQDDRVQTLWNIESRPGDKHTIKISGASVSTEEGRLAAHLLDARQVEWTITPSGQDLYFFSQNGKYIDVPNEETREVKLTQTRPSQGFKLTRQSDD